MATLAARRFDREGQADPNRVKVVVDRGGFALYFSRAAIPYSREEGPDPWLYHVGTYGFRPRALARFAASERGLLERRERLEQLRFLEMGMTIRVGIVAEAAPGVDTPEDYEKFVKRTGKQRFGRS